MQTSNYKMHSVHGKKYTGTVKQMYIIIMLLLNGQMPIKNSSPLMVCTCTCIKQTQINFNNKYEQ